MTFYNELNPEFPVIEVFIRRFWYLGAIFVVVIGAGRTDASINIPGSNIKNDTTTQKLCSKTITQRKISAVIKSRNCYRRQSTTTGILWWRKTRYYTKSETCYVQQYKSRLTYLKDPVCCQGFTEKDGLCLKEKNNCSNGFYGDKCEACSCGTNALPGCDRITGECFCKDGFMGINCTLTVPKCKAGNQSCQCSEPGLVAPSCDEPCEDGFHGYDCMEQCECSENEICDPVTGECLLDTKLKSTNVTEVESKSSMDSMFSDDDGNSSSIIAGTFIGIVIAMVLFTVIAVLVYRRKLRRKRAGMQIDNLSYGLIRQSGESYQSTTHHYGNENQHGIEINNVSESAEARGHTLGNCYQEVDCKRYEPSTKSKAVDNDYTFVAFKPDNSYLAMNISNKQSEDNDKGATGCSGNDIYVLPSVSNNTIYDVPKPLEETYSIPRNVPREINKN